MLPNEIQLPKLSFRSKVADKITKTGRLLEIHARALAHKLRFFLDAISLGLVKPSAIESLVEFAYKSRPNYYNLDSYQPTWEEEIIPHLKELTSSRRMLLAFCGKGRDAFLLARHGYEVLAIDREKFMIDSAIEANKELDLNIEFKIANFDDFQSNPFEIVFPSIWMFTTYPNKTRRRKFLQQCQNLLSSDGVVVLSYRRQTKPLSESFRFLVAKTTALLTLGNTSVNKGDCFASGIFWHYFTETEIETELAEAGFETLLHKSRPDGFIEWRIIKPLSSSSEVST